ncbi:MAG: thiamine pyrophosphate-binding protein [Deltaproteobacteria bacterium]|nr:thiamine pyrophosphate-binding protein [Deltaproteobacteria bacterium]MBI3388210.1 thiamine pyrophosphate-binding protein [Deltaproteobacteria bacterium]
MSAITGGELLARCLANEGVKFVFGLPSPEIDPLLAQLAAHEIRLFPVRHEAAGVHMAEGLYKTTGQVAAVLGNPGPGSANLLPGVITARHEGVPVVAITSQHRLGLVYPSPPSTFQGQDQLDVFKPCVKWGGPILSWERIPEVVRIAFREMWTGRPGPVHIELPAPVLYATGEEQSAPVLPPDSYRAPRPQASDAQLRQAAELLANAQRPLVLAGAGVDRADANAALLELVTLLNCPVMTTMAGRSAVPLDHSNYIFGFGRGADVVKQEADVVLVAASRLGNLDLPFDKYWGDPSHQRLIQIDIDARNMGVTRPLALGIVADAKHTIEGLVQLLRNMKARPRDGADLARYRQAAQAWWDELLAPIAGWKGPGIHPAHVLQTVGAVFGKNAVYTADGGNTSLWAHSCLPPTQPRSYHNILELGMLGTGIPSAIGAKLGASQREVVCVTGDGAAGFNFMEMQSAARDGVKITTIVFAEGSWTMEEPNEQMLYGQTFGTQQGTVRWDRVAEGLGCYGEYAERIEDVESALRRAKAAKGPAVVCVKTDRDANLAIPMELLMRFAEVYQGPMG